MKGGILFNFCAFSHMQVLIMDKFTVKIMAYACKMAEITDAGISCESLKPGHVAI